MGRYDERRILVCKLVFSRLENIKAEWMFLEFLQLENPTNYPKGSHVVRHFSNTVNDGILYARKAEDFAKVFRDSFGIGCCIVTGKQIGRAHV